MSHLRLCPRDTADNLLTPSPEIDRRRILQAGAEAETEAGAEAEAEAEEATENQHRIVLAGRSNPRQIRCQYCCCLT